MTKTNPKRSKYSTISTESRATIYLQLSRLEQAGFPAQQAFELIQKDNKQQLKQLHQLQHYLKSGNSISESGYRAGIFSASDKDLLKAGESSGNLAEVYQLLARYYGQKVRRFKKIKSQCYLPLMTLVIALFVQPLPALISNEITGLDYLFASVGLFIKVVLFSYVTFKLPFWLTQGGLRFLGLARLVYSLQLKLPIISPWLITRQVNEFLRSLGMMLTAGVPILDALPKSIQTITNPVLRKKFDSVILATHEGGSLTNSLANISEINEQAIQLLGVGEKTGKLAKSITQHVKIETETINLQEDLLAEWLPRIFYLCVVGWVATSMIAGNSVNSLPVWL